MNGMIGGWSRDLLHAARALRRARGFTAVTVTTLALAIGSNTAIFSVVDAVLLDPLSFPESDRLVSILGTAPGSDLPDEVGVPDELFVRFREDVSALQDVGMYGMMQSTMRTDEWVERLFMVRVTPSFFSTLRVSPMLGRLPVDEDGENGVVISHGLWMNRLGADEAVIGRSFEMAGAQRTVVGVMPPDFNFPDRRASLWISFPIDAARVTPGGLNWNVVGRLAPGADIRTLEAQTEPLARRLPEQLGGPPQYARIMELYRPVIRTLEEQVVGDIAGPLWVLLATAGIVLLIACANVANLFIARAESRRQDLAVRRAVGAGRGGLIRAQMAEALLLAGMGGIGGTFIAWFGVPLLVRSAPEGTIGLETVTLDVNALLFTAGASVLAALVFGLLPAIRFSNPGLAGGLRQGGLGRARGSGGSRSRDALVVVQTASALVLLVGSGLLVQSFWKLNRVDPGYDTHDIFTFQIAPTGPHLNDGPAYARFHQDFMERLAGLPGVGSVGVVETLPLDEGARSTRFATELSEVSGEEGPVMHVTFTGGDYFQTMGIELLSGRAFESIDEGTGVSNAIVSRSAAERLWPGESPLGQRLRPLAIPTDNWWTVVGVVEDIMLYDFRQPEPEPLVYLPLVGPSPEQSWTIGSPAYVVRTDRAELIAPEIRALARQVAPDAPMYRVFTMRGLAARSMAQLTFTMLTLTVVSVLALVLAAVGLYGVLSYVVSQRTREIAVRMALGAKSAEVRRMIVLQGGRVALVGVALGLLAAVALTRVLGTLLFGVDALDELTFVAIPAAMIAVALLASYLPARRASSVDPMTALRGE